MTATLAALAQTHFNIELSAEMSATFDRYAAELLDWNTRLNLTSITDPYEVRIKHFLDALSLLSLPDLPAEAKVIDVGTGAGLPGLALGIVRPGWQITLMDATGKKVDFLSHVIQTLQLPNVRAIKMRAEEAGQHAQHRAQYDLVVARAVARLPILLEYLLPLGKVGGLCIAMKGETAQAERDDSTYALQVLGGEVTTIHPIKLPEVENTHYLVTIRKTKKTPAEYPRRSGLPSKNPLVRS